MSRQNAVFLSWSVPNGAKIPMSSMFQSPICWQLCLSVVPSRRCEELDKQRLIPAGVVIKPPLADTYTPWPRTHSA